MALLAQLVKFLDEELKTTSISDYPGAMNGLQLANSGEVNRIISAVDASLAVIEAVAEAGNGLLIVHHGMFWQGAQPVTGAFYRKLKIAIEADLAIYSSHLPLDIHPEYGNNILLARKIGLKNIKPLSDQRGVMMGVRGEWTGTRGELVQILKILLKGEIHLCPGGADHISEIGVITGGAGSEVAKVSASGVDCFVTGEGPHWSYTLAEDLGLNVIYGGHYATETFGVRAMSKLLAEQYSLEASFMDHPSGL